MSQQQKETIFNEIIPLIEGLNIPNLEQEIKEGCLEEELFDLNCDSKNDFRRKNIIKFLINSVLKRNIVASKYYIGSKVELLDNMTIWSWFVRNIIVVYCRNSSQNMLTYNENHYFIYGLLDEYYEDPEVIGEFSRIDFRIFHEVQSDMPELMDDYDYMKQIIRIRPCAFMITNSDEMGFEKYRDLAILTMECSPDMYSNLPYILKNEENVSLTAVKNNSDNYQHFLSLYWERGLTEHTKEVLIASIITSDDEKRFKRDEENECKYPNLYYKITNEIEAFTSISCPEYYTEPDILRAIEIRTEIWDEYENGIDLQIINQLFSYEIPVKKNIDYLLEICKEPLNISTLGGDEYQIENWFLTYDLPKLMTEKNPDLEGCDVNFEEYNISDYESFNFKKYIIEKIIETGEFPKGLIIFPEVEE